MRLSQTNTQNRKGAFSPQNATIESNQTGPFLVIAPFAHVQAFPRCWSVGRIPALFSHLPIITLLGWSVGLATRSGEPLRRSTGQV